MSSKMSVPFIVDLSNHGINEASNSSKPNNDATAQSQLPKQGENEPRYLFGILVLFLMLNVYVSEK